MQMVGRNWIAGIMLLCACLAQTARADQCTSDSADVCAAPNAAGSMSESHRWSTAFYAGLQWNFGTRHPELVVGVRRAVTDRNDHAYGAKLDVTLPLAAQEQLKPVIRALALAGTRSVQAEAGLGWSLVDNVPLASVGVQAPYLNAGATYGIGRGWQMYAGVNALGRLAAPRWSDGVASCPLYQNQDMMLLDVLAGNLVWSEGANQNVALTNTSLVRNGKICVVWGA